MVISTHTKRLIHDDSRDLVVFDPRSGEARRLARLSYVYGVEDSHIAQVRKPAKMSRRFGGAKLRQVFRSMRDLVAQAPPRRTL